MLNDVPLKRQRQMSISKLDIISSTLLPWRAITRSMFFLNLIVYNGDTTSSTYLMVRTMSMTVVIWNDAVAIGSSFSVKHPKISHKLP